LTADAFRQALANLAPGSYSIQVTWNGFSDFSRTAEVGANRETTIDAVLNVETSADSVTVTELPNKSQRAYISMSCCGLSWIRRRNGDLGQSRPPVVQMIELPQSQLWGGSETCC